MRHFTVSRLFVFSCIVGGVTSGCGADGQSVVLDTSRCMESKGYRVVTIERRKA